MTKMDMIERFYGRNEELERTFAAAEKAGDAAAMDACQDAYQEPEKILKTFREFGVTEFTFSSSWSSAIQVVWAFTQMGCTLKGMIEIYGSGRKIMSKEYEKVPAFLFSL